MNDQTREAALRRLARNYDLQPQRKATDGGEAGYMLVDIPGNYIAYGGSPLPFSATLDEIAEYLDGLKRQEVASW